MEVLRDVCVGHNGGNGWAKGKAIKKCPNGLFIEGANSDWCINKKHCSGEVIANTSDGAQVKIVPKKWPNEPFLLNLSPEMFMAYNAAMF